MIGHNFLGTMPEYLWSKISLTFQRVVIFPKIPKKDIPLTPGTKNLTIQNTSAVSCSVLLCATNRCSHKLFITTATCFVLTTCLCGVPKLSKFSEMYFHIWQFPWSAWKAKRWADVEVLLCPLHGKLRSLTILRGASEAPQLVLTHMRLNCQLTACRKRDHRTKHKRIQGEVAFYFYNLVCVWEVFAQSIRSQEAHIQLLHCSVIEKKSLSKLCLVS